MTITLSQLADRMKKHSDGLKFDPDDLLAAEAALRELDHVRTVGESNGVGFTLQAGLRYLDLSNETNARLEQCK